MTIYDIVARTKQALRVSNTDTLVNEEVNDLVAECLEKLNRSIDNVVDLSDPLVLKACKAYAGANYSGNSIEEREAWETRFRRINAELGTYDAIGSGSEDCG